MKKRNGILTGLIAIYAACVISATNFTHSRQPLNKPIEEIFVATTSVRYLINDVSAAIELYTRLNEPAGVHYLIDDARAAIDFHRTHFGFNADSTAAPSGITPGRARALLAAFVGLISVVIGGLALARTAGRLGSGTGPVVAVVALVLGLIGVILSVVHLGTSTGGFGTGGGRAGAIVALVLGLLGLNLGGLAVVRSRRTGNRD